ncbi:hypothetical protein PI124_g12294 [Phytophthora idaei]|nr:hypothetical protein PI125_g11805 [Phytophthora idaei]KAG3151865.1 hypothetical protein PI126_g10783 [Phytophthora idaei]KAG3242859.1 hypothetical protein PI124_g12294 [Phytophthora idaei]
MDSSKPGVEQCQSGPSAEIEKKDLRRKFDGVLTNGAKVGRMFEHYLKALPLPPINPEKVYTMHHTVRRYVPEEFRSDPIYKAPTHAEGENAKSAKQSRREHRASMAVAAKENADRRGQDIPDEEAPPSKRKRSEQSAVV